METPILIALLLLAVLATWILVRRSNGFSSEMQAALRQEFLTLQSRLNSDLNAARQSMEGTSGVVADQTIMTISQIKEIGETMHRLVQQQEEVQHLGQSLKDLLQAPKLRGSYGETILEEMLDRILPPGLWQRQYIIEGAERVDCAVMLRGIVVPIDAKFPRDDYARYIESESDEEKQRHWRGFETSVKSQIRRISSKYIKPECGTADFALMFIPSESIYYETIAERNHLGHPSSIWQHAQSHHVIPVGPNTFYAFLQVVIISIKNAEIGKNAKELQASLAKLERDFKVFYERHQDTGAAIERASEAYRIGEGHIQRFKRRLDATVQLDGDEKQPYKLAEKEDNDD